MRRNWFIAAIVIGVSAIVIAAVAMRLSDNGSSQPTTEEWASSVCTSLTTWRSSIDALASTGGGQLTPDVLRQKLSDAQAATSQLVTELRGLGAPNTEAGDQLRSQLETSTSQLQSSFDQLEQSAQAAADAPAGQFLQKLAGLAPDFAALQAAVSGTVTTLQNADVGEQSKAELQQAFADAPACQSLQAQR